jgi:putative two-component system response regulator
MQCLQRPDIRVLGVDSAPAALQALAEMNPDLVLIDADDPALDSLKLCRMMELGQRSPLPVFLVSAKASPELEIDAIEAGVEAILPFPSSERLIQARVGAALRRRSSQSAVLESESVLFTLAQFVEERDASLGAHCQRLSSITALVGMSLGLPSSDILNLQRASYLHDVGKIGIPDRVLFKPGPLTPEEWDVMKTHAARGEKICSSVRSLAPVLPLIRHHHERWDGSGYPDGLRGDQIPALAQILQLADIYDALTAARPYKRAFTPAEALGIMNEEAAKGWRDPDLLRRFARLSPLFDSPESAELGPLSLGSLSASLKRAERLVLPNAEAPVVSA